jgi:cyclic pyranopterin phosphate synthase
MRISVTELCNLRCRYCMPEEGVCKKSHCDMMTEDETIEVIKVAAELGVEKLRITGGEPLVKKNILSICRRAAEVPGIREVCITTNATLLESMAKPLIDAGVTCVNISLDTLDAEKYRHITRGGELKDALAGFDAAMSAGFRRVKMNAVLIGGFNDDEIPALVGLTMDKDIDMRFIELMPMYHTDEFGKEAFIPAKTVLERIPGLEELPKEGGVATMYRLPGARGRVGLISPVSDHFCSKCNRLRLTADGKLKPCLHSPQEYSIRGLDAEGIRKQILKAVQAKPESHRELSADQISEAGRSMDRIGG